MAKNKNSIKKTLKDMGKALKRDAQKTKDDVKGMVSKSSHRNRGK